MTAVAICCYLTLGLAWTLGGLRDHPDLRERHRDFAEKYGTPAGFLMFLGPIVLWLPMQLTVWALALRDRLLVRRLVRRKRELLEVIQDLDATMQRMAAINEEVAELRKIEDAPGVEARVDDLARRMFSEELHVGELMAVLMERRCLDCPGPVTGRTSSDGPGASCGACGRFYHFKDIRKYSRALQARELGE